MDNCVFCNIITKKIHSYKVLEDEYIIAFLDKDPIKPGHTLMVPKIHTADIVEMEQSAYATLWRSVQQFSAILKHATGSKRIGIAVEGFTVPHVHVHLVPVNSANELDPCKAQEATDEALSQMQKKILSSINK